jgi:hypothetical protein
MGAGVFILTFGRFSQHAQSLPSSNSTSQQIQYVSNNLVSSYKGTFPVILTSPHDGNQQPSEVNVRTWLIVVILEYYQILILV